jgi:hypothetical protein
LTIRSIILHEEFKIADKSSRFNRRKKEKRASFDTKERMAKDSEQAQGIKAYYVNKIEVSLLLLSPWPTV